jgi:hypothetical protein
MFRGKYRWVFRFAVLLAAAGGFLLWSWYQERTPTLVVENQSGQPIAVLNVTAGGETSTAKDVKSGDKVGTPLKIKGEDWIVLKGQFEDGNSFQGRFRPGPGGEPLDLIVMPGGQIIPRPRGK